MFNILSLEQSSLLNKNFIRESMAISITSSIPSLQFVEDWMEKSRHYRHSELWG